MVNLDADVFACDFELCAFLGAAIMSEPTYVIKQNGAEFASCCGDVCNEACLRRPAARGTATGFIVEIGLYDFDPHVPWQRPG